MFDLGLSDEPGRQIIAANERRSVIDGVCHGPLGLLGPLRPTVVRSSRADVSPR